MPPKWEKSTDDDQNLIGSQGGQDTSACRISSHSKWLQSKGVNFIYDVTTKTKWKGTIGNKIAKNTKLQFLQNPERMFIKLSRGIIIDN